MCVDPATSRLIIETPKGCSKTRKVEEAKLSGYDYRYKIQSMETKTILYVVVGCG